MGWACQWRVDGVRNKARPPPPARPMIPKRLLQAGVILGGLKHSAGCCCEELFIAVIGMGLTTGWLAG